MYSKLLVELLLNEQSNHSTKTMSFTLSKENAQYLTRDKLLELKEHVNSYDT